MQNYRSAQLKITILILFLIFSYNKLLASDIPIIVIAPGKSIQSYSTVGSSVSAIDNKKKLLQF